LVKANWRIELKLEDAKAILERIIQLIDSQLRLCNDDCFALLLVGEFVESSEYLQLRIKEEFSKRVQFIFIPPNPKLAIVKGGKYITSLYFLIKNYDVNILLFY
jgi:hypothetical protein